MVPFVLYQPSLETTRVSVNRVKRKTIMCQHELASPNFFLKIATRNKTIVSSTYDDNFMANNITRLNHVEHDLTQLNHDFFF